MDNTEKDWLDDTRLTIVVGYSGSGKTEFSVNLALSLAERGRPTALADLDVVDPYFRSRERRTLLKDRGVRLVATSQACVDADVPAMPAELNTLLQDRTLYSVLDIGGGAGGARVLARYRPQLLNQPRRVCFVLNGRRPGTNSVEGALDSLAGIQTTLGLAVTHLVGNTHLCGETGPEDLKFGADLCREVSRRAGIPILCHAVHQPLLSRTGELGAPLFPIRLYMNKPWETGEIG